MGRRRRGQRLEPVSSSRGVGDIAFALVCLAFFWAVVSFLVLCVDSRSGMPEGVSDGLGIQLKLSQPTGCPVVLPFRRL